jgi:hypothetical protein
MTRIYIIHPFRGRDLPGERERNRVAIAGLCRRIAARGDVPISPVHCLSWLNDEIPEERALAMTLCRELLRTSDRAEVYGDWAHSDGCEQEMHWATLDAVPLFVKEKIRI